MAEWSQFGRLLIIGGLVITVAGLAMVIGARVPFLGRLPGDLTFRRGSWTISAPLATSLLLSVILTIVIKVIVRR